MLLKKGYKEIDIFLINSNGIIISPEERNKIKELGIEINH